jgi:3,4-dihydroxyphenylacetate 2,3-dioxygenase
MAAHADEHGTWITAIDDPCLPVHYAMVNLWTYLGRGLDRRWVGTTPCSMTDSIRYWHLAASR